MTGFLESYKNAMMSYSDVNEYMDIFSNTFVINNFDILENYVFEFKERYDFVVTTTFSPACSLDGIEINDIYSTDKERLKGVF